MCLFFRDQVRSVISQILPLWFFFLERDYARKWSVAVHAAGRPVPGSSLRILYVNDDGSFSLERSYQLSAASLDLSWWQLNTDQDCSLVEYWLGSGRKRLGLDAWTVELVSSMHAPADGHKNNSVEKCSASAQPLSPLLQTQNIWRCSSYYMQIPAWCKPRTQWTS